jgi:hypothetical protein
MTSSIITFRPDAKELKEKHSLAELANKFGFSFKENYNNECPFCGKPKPLPFFVKLLSIKITY